MSSHSVKKRHGLPDPNQSPSNGMQQQQWFFSLYSSFFSAAVFSTAQANDDPLFMQLPSSVSTLEYLLNGCCEGEEGARRRLCRCHSCTPPTTGGRKKKEGGSRTQVRDRPRASEGMWREKYTGVWAVIARHVGTLFEMTGLAMEGTE